MSDKMYMNGRGIIRHTERLNSRLFDMVPRAIIGMSIAWCAPFLAWAFFIHKFPWDDPATNLDWVLAITTSAVAIVVGLKIYWPWRLAYKAVTAHRKAMDAETAKRGEGWAES